MRYELKYITANGSDDTHHYSSSDNREVIMVEARELADYWGPDATLWVEDTETGKELFLRELVRARYAVRYTEKYVPGVFEGRRKDSLAAAQVSADSTRHFNSDVAEIWVADTKTGRVYEV